MKLTTLVLFTSTLLISACVFAHGDAHQHNENQPVAAPRSDANPTLEAWSKEYPEHLSMYMEMKNTSKPTEFGGNTPYSKLIRFPQLTELWAGYAFAVDFNEERSHYYTQIDQYETKRNDKEFLNSHGFAKFKGQPGACMNCHSGWVPELVREMGWENFNRTPYWDTVKKLKEEHGGGIHGAEMGSTCADCHTADDMSLRVTRPAYINAMVDRGYEKDEKLGLKASQEEMRTHVCQQCHVEYYFQGKDKVLTFPWSEWPKDEPLKVEMIEEYYDKARDAGTFTQDWTHKTTRAAMLKMQHPEAEMSSSGRHTRDGISCVDCHMPVTTRNGEEVTDHNLDSPLNDVTVCQSCHAHSKQTTEQVEKMAQDVQRHTANELHQAEYAILALINDIKEVREQLAKHQDFKNITDSQAQEKAISAAIAPALEMHRRASLRWDFVGAENSTGIHSPREAWRVLDDAEAMARQGQEKLQTAAAKYGITVELTDKGPIPVPPPVINLNDIVGSMPPAITGKADDMCQQ
ncbi:ammonia-forming cytochrome c nitrite reductase subunit c552 [Thalassotalea sp. PLHSN55]|uniref:ammonia-forming cytochrome c nitrite reductase subunit c552 n=1 Tax=Thalassotalea sp. PLHSN55 TaxID=3435888 RepID=UPI003F85A375